MNQLFQDSVFFGVLISLAAYGIGMLLKLKTGWSLMNPLLISIILPFRSPFLPERRRHGFGWSAARAVAESIRHRKYICKMNNLIGCIPKSE